MPNRLVLASQSRIRRTLMENAGLVFETASPDIDERQVENDMMASDRTPPDLALKLAEAKALDVSRRLGGATVIGCDQVLSLDGMIFHKPADMGEARNHLLSMSGKVHHLNCGVVIAKDDTIVWRHVSIARLTARPLSDAFIARHLARVGPSVLASVGAYQLEGEGVQLFERIDGDYFTVLGLPLLPLLAQLRTLGMIDA